MVRDEADRGFDAVTDDRVDPERGQQPRQLLAEHGRPAREHVDHGPNAERAFDPARDLQSVRERPRRQAGRGERPEVEAESFDNQGNVRMVQEGRRMSPSYQFARQSGHWIDMAGGGDAYESKMRHVASSGYSKTSLRAGSSPARRSEQS